MKRNYTFKLLFRIAVVWSLLMAASCARNDLDYVSRNGGEVKYAVSLSNVPSPDGTKSAVSDGISEDARVIELKSADGSIVLPMYLTVTDLVDESEQNAAAGTKGFLVNGNGSGTDRLENCKSPKDGTMLVDNFKVKSFDDVTSIYDGTVSWTNNSWKPDKVSFWPQTHVLDFYAYANLPASSNVFVTVDHPNRKQKLDYTVPKYTKDQKDILMAVYSGTGNNNGEAELTFYHPLTAVQFSCTGSELITGFYDITMSGVYFKGSTEQLLDDPATFNWTTDATEHTVIQDNDGKPFEVYGEINGEPFLLIPQDTGDRSVDLTVTVGYNGHQIPLNSTITGVTWEPGKKYTYNIDVEGMLEIAVALEEPDANRRANAIITNVGTKDCFVRAKMVGYIINADKEIKGTWLNPDGSNKGEFTPAGFGSETVAWNTSWIKGSDGFYYYKKPLKFSTKDSTTPLFNEYSISGINLGEEFEMVLSAQAILYDQNAQYVKDNWGNVAYNILKQN